MNDVSAEVLKIKIFDTLKFKDKRIPISDQ
jgi:hypothetical protein